MANKSAFTAEEWQQVLGSVFMAGFTVTATDPSGLWGMLKESVDAVGQAGAIVDAKAPAEAADFKRWLLATANQVADVEGRRLPRVRRGYRQ